MAEDEKVAVLIDGQEFFGWSEVDLHLQMDTFSSVEFLAPFEPEQSAFRETFRPFTFKPLEITIDDSRAFKGTLVGIDPASDANSNSVRVSGYSLPAVLEDCTEPASAVPIEFKKLGLREIMEAVAKPFGFNVDFRIDARTPFDKVKLDVDAKVHAFLAELARQRNAVISSTPDGALLCWRSVAPGQPVARLKDEAEPVSSVSAKFNPQEYFSEITGFVPTTKKRRGSKYTEKNPFLPAILRPSSFKLDDTEKGDAPEATRARLGRMLANMAAFTVEVATWRDPLGDLWKPNTTLMLEAPSAMVYREYEFLIRAVSLHQDKDVTAATLDLVLPGAFNGTIPEVLPWD